jgi:selenocysteine lyase/cysteine desulfurase
LPRPGFCPLSVPAFAEPSLQGQAFFENAGGSYACTQVIGLLNEYYRRLRVQPYYSYPAATEAGQWMDRAHVRLGEYLNVAPEEIHLGPSTSQNTYVLAQALRKCVARRSALMNRVAGHPHVLALCVLLRRLFERVLKLRVH